MREHQRQRQLFTSSGVQCSPIQHTHHFPWRKNINVSAIIDGKIQIMQHHDDCTPVMTLKSCNNSRIST